jgi:hypothetical protein
MKIARATRGEGEARAAVPLEGEREGSPLKDELQSRLGLVRAQVGARR